MWQRVAVVVLTLAVMFDWLLLSRSARKWDTRSALLIAVPVFVVMPTLGLWSWNLDVPLASLFRTGGLLSLLSLACCGIWACRRGRKGGDRGEGAPDPHGAVRRERHPRIGS